MSERKARPTYTDEQKAEVKKLLQEGKTHNEIVDITNVGKGTVVKIAADLKAGASGTAKRSTTSATSTDVFKAELAAIQNRKREVEELLNGVLKQELDALSLKETTLEDLIKLYK